MKQFGAILLTGAFLLALAGCGQSSRGGSSEVPPEDKSGAAQSAVSAGGESLQGQGGQVVQEYGSYTLPAGWYEYEEISAPGRPFYLPEGVEVDGVISNISVECGPNPYTAEEHEAFRQAIFAQLGAQAAAVGAELDAAGRSTAAGDVMFVFTLREEGADTVQYYIVGENQFVMVHVTDLRDERIPDVVAVGAAIADSFVWA